MSTELRICTNSYDFRSFRPNEIAKDSLFVLAFYAFDGVDLDHFPPIPTLGITGSTTTDGGGSFVVNIEGRGDILALKQYCELALEHLPMPSVTDVRNAIGPLKVTS